MPRKPTPSENSIKLAVMEFLTYQGCFVFRNNSGALPNEKGRLVFFGQTGSADILGCTREGRFLAIELKRPGYPHPPTKPQVDFLEQVASHNGLAGIATDVDEAADILRGKPFDSAYWRDRFNLWA